MSMNGCGNGMRFTVAQLIEALQAFDAQAVVWIEGDEDGDTDHFLINRDDTAVLLAPCWCLLVPPDVQEALA